MKSPASAASIIFYITYLLVICFLVFGHEAQASSQSTFRIQILPEGSQPEEEPPIPGGNAGGPQTPQSAPRTDDRPPTLIEKTHERLVEKVEEMIKPSQNKEGVAPPTFSGIDATSSGDHILQWVFTTDIQWRGTVSVTLPKSLEGIVAEMEVKPVIFYPEYASGTTEGVVYDISAYDQSGKGVLTFADPVRVSIGFPPELGTKYSLGLYHFDEDAQQWQIIENALRSENAVSFETYHFSLFGIFALPKDSAVPGTVSPQEGSTEMPAYSASEVNKIKALSQILVISGYVLAILLAIFSGRWFIRASNTRPVWHS